MTKKANLPVTLRTLRASLDLTQEQLADRLGVSFATVNRWEGGTSKPQKAAAEAIQALAVEAGIATEELSSQSAAVEVSRRRSRTPRSVDQAMTTKPMEQMLWDAACSIRGEKDAAKFKDYLLPLVFLKRLSDVFDDEVSRLAEDYGDKATALEIAETDHSLLRFYLPPEARWAVISGREKDGERYVWPLDDKGRSTAPKDAGEHLTRALRGVVKHNPSLSGVIDVVDFAAERNGERDINPAKLRAVIETFSDPRYRLGLADVQPDFLGRAYEYLLRKFAEGSGQSAGEFFTPTEAGFLMAHILRPRPGETCHDYACGSGGLLIKLQLVSRELDPMAKVPLKLFGQELEGASYAVAHMNAKIHDMDMELARGNSMLNPKFRTADGRIQRHDIVIANPMWNQPFDAETTFANDPYDRFRTTGGITSGKGDWAWLQHTLACLNDHGRAAVVLDTGAVTRGSGSKNEDKERNIRKWFVDQDLIDGVILLPDNLFYNTTAAGVIVVLSRRKPAARQGRIVLLNASKRFRKGKPKNYLPEEDIRPLAAMFLKGEAIDGELEVITRDEAVEADYNLLPNRWVGQSSATKAQALRPLLDQLAEIDRKAAELASSIKLVLSSVDDGISASAAASPEQIGSRLGDYFEVTRKPRGLQFDDEELPFIPMDAIPQGGAYEPKTYGMKAVSAITSGTYIERGNLLVSKITPSFENGKQALVKGLPAERGYATTEVIPLRARQLGTDERLAFFHLLQPQVRAFIAERMEGSTGRQRVPERVLLDLPYPNFSPDAQKTFADTLELIQVAIGTCDLKRAALEDLFNALLHKLMTGEIGVNDLDLQALATMERSPA